jgi:hypothetical protein
MSLEQEYLMQSPLLSGAASTKEHVSRIVFCVETIE